MQRLFIPPEGYDRIKVVGSFEELIEASFGPTVNALCWPRALTGDFDEIAALLRDEEDIVSLDEPSIDNLRKNLNTAGRIAADFLVNDLRLMQAQGLSPSLECVPRYRRDDATKVIPTDVYSFHADRAPVQADTYLCSYNESASEGLRNDEAQKCAELREIRAELQNRFKKDAEGAEDFDAYLRENCYDLHYAPFENAVPFSFGLGNLWRIAIEYPAAPVPPCLHRAPKTVEGRLPRLLLIS